MNAQVVSSGPKSARIVPNLFAGAISGLMTVIAGISYATLIFSGTLGSQLQLGIAAALICATVVGLVVAVRSSSPYVIAGPDANISAIMALIAAAVASRQSSAASAESLGASLWATMVACSLLAGVFLFLVGRFRLGHWIRYIPYPVVGGFLAGTGWILARGSVKVMCGTSLSLKTMGDLVHADTAAHWLPGAAFALVLLVVLRRFKHYLVMPVMLVAAILVAHAALFIGGLSISEAIAKGWLLSAFPQDLVWRTYSGLAFSQIDMVGLTVGAGNLAAMVIVAAIVILLNSASVELETRHDIDLDRELKASGIANVIAAPLGALTGCIALSRSILNHKAGASSRLSGIVSALFCGAILLLAAPALTLFPKPVLGGLLMYLGLSLLVDWVVDGWSRLSRLDYFLVLGILVIIGMWGFLPGVGIGLVIACMMFAFNYSRINVVKQALSGAVFHSNVERSYDERAVLRERGDRIRILRLQGFIFFGSAYPLLVNVRQMLAAGPATPSRFFVLDFSAVSGMDSSSVLSFRKMKDAVANAGARLLLVGLRPEVRRLLVEGGCLPADQTGVDDSGSACREFADLDYASGWCEEQVLADRAAAAAATPRIADHLAALFPKPELIPRLMKYLQRIDATPGQVLYQQGQPSGDLYFLESGRVTALLELPGEHTRKRLRTMGPGTVVGEMGLYMGTPRSATVIAEESAVLYSLSVESMAAIEREDLPLAAALHRFFVRLLADRLRHANKELAGLMS